MAIKFEKQTEKYLIESIKRFFAEELDDNIGDLKASRVLYESEAETPRTSLLAGNTLHFQ